jgi:hypothetical protein
MANKLKIPKSVIDLKLTRKRFAKKNNIRLKGKDLTNKDKNRNRKKLNNLYSEAMLNGLNKAIMIISENKINKTNEKKINRIRKDISNLIPQSKIMKRIAKLYSKKATDYPNIIYLPKYIIDTIEHYSLEGLNDKEKAIGENLNKEELLDFCNKVLKKEIKKYEKNDLSPNASFILSSVAPNLKLFKNSWEPYYNLMQALFNIAIDEEVDLTKVFDYIKNLENKKDFNKKEFYKRFFSTFIARRVSNKDYSFTDHQKTLKEELIDKSLEYLNGLKSGELKEILKEYIKHRRGAESDKSDSKRVIKFIDYANSNSEYAKLQSVVKELIADNSSNELYLS